MLLLEINTGRIFIVIRITLFGLFRLFLGKTNCPVGARGFEPAVSCTPWVLANRKSSELLLALNP